MDQATIDDIIDVGILEELCYFHAGMEYEGWKVVQRTYVTSGRWTEEWEAVITQDDKTYYKFDFELPATEYQEGIGLFECGHNLRRVFPVERTVIDYLTLNEKFGKVV